MRLNKSQRYSFKWLVTTFVLVGGLYGNAPVAANKPETEKSITAVCKQAEREMNFNENWKFHLGDTAGASARQFNDRSWRTINLPHDWSIEGCPEINNPSGNDGGYYPAGIGWYRKTFNFQQDNRLTETIIYFEGVYMNATVFVNGHELGTHPYGFTSFFYDITPYLRTGENTMAIKVDNSQQKNCRWYTGSGIYRNVKLIRTPKMRFEPWGTSVSTITVSPQQTVQVETTVANRLDRPQQAVVQYRVLDDDNLLAQKKNMSLWKPARHVHSKHKSR